jgi:predicted permease
MAHVGAFSDQDKKRFIPGATKFVFYVALPSLVIKGLGIGINFYDEKIMSWEYICSFLALRAVAFALIVVAIAATSTVTTSLMTTSTPSSTTTASAPTTTNVGQVVVYWLASTWISTVILGVPIVSAVFGNPNLGLQYGILAGVSSFIFQLPVQLFLLECHRTLSTSSSSSLSSAPSSPPDKEQVETDEMMTTMKHEEDAQDLDSGVNEVEDEEQGGTSSPQCQEKTPESVEVTLFDLFFRRGDVWKKLFWHLAVNPVLWAIIVGFILTLSTVGPRYLRPSSSDYVVGLGWIWLTLTWLGDCVSPVALFSMGVWMQQRHEALADEHEERRPLKLRLTTIVRIVGFMIIKLILVPLLMVGLALAFKLDDQSGRAAVLIASLPISLASFTLASQYGIGEAVLSENVVMGTLLILPCVLGWNACLDAVGLFPIHGQ